jgi:para-nitrobenzyl esterase
LFQRVIAESGAWMGLGVGKMTPLAQAEDNGKQLAMTLGAATLADLRAKSAEDIQRSGRSSGVIVDGWIIPEDLSNTFAQARQNEVDVLVGSNQDEGTFLSRGSVTAQQFTTQARQRFADQADAFLKLYPADTDAEASASELTRVRDELAWHMRTWAKLQSKKSKSKAYVFYFTRTPPGTNRGATHTAELSYVFNNLAPNAAWTDLDRKLADTMSSYWANFAATGDPNGKGLPVWPGFKEKGAWMVLGDTVEVGPGLEAPRVAIYDGLYAKQLAGR